jgi:hypothetical protein
VHGGVFPLAVVGPTKPHLPLAGFFAIAEGRSIVLSEATVAIGVELEAV